jgi:thiol-disulfide isomerase/thioredoxin
LSAAAEGEKADGKYFTRLKLIKETLAKGPNAALAAFVVFRFLTTENNIAILQTQNISDVQDKWRASLEEFAKTYPNTEEAPEAVLRLAMAFEYQKDGEPKAKEWYAKLAQNYAKHPHAAKSLGAIKRLESEGKPFELVGPVLENGQVFNVSALSGNPVLVYYCANWSQTLAADTKQLQALAKQYEPKGLRIVTVLLDNEAKTAAATAGTYQIPGVHLFMPGGLDASPLASNYGVQVLPHLFIVGKDGKVLNRNAHFNTLEDDVKKLLP